jgi:hypothetical protein
MREAGINPVFKDMSVAPALGVMAELLYTYLPEMNPPEPSLVISQECTELIDGFVFGYVQDPKRHQEGTSDELQPYKDGYFEHLMDALRYIVVNTRHSKRSRMGNRRTQGAPGKWVAEEQWDGYRKRWYGEGAVYGEDAMRGNDRPAFYNFGSTDGEDP